MWSWQKATISGTEEKPKWDTSGPIQGSFVFWTCVSVPETGAVSRHEQMGWTAVRLVVLLPPIACSQELRQWRAARDSKNILFEKKQNKQWDKHSKHQTCARRVLLAVAKCEWFVSGTQPNAQMELICNGAISRMSWTLPHAKREDASQPKKGMPVRTEAV